MSNEAEERYKKLQKQVVEKNLGVITVELKCEVLEALLKQNNGKLDIVCNEPNHDGEFQVEPNINRFELCSVIAAENPRIVYESHSQWYSLKINLNTP